MSLNLIDEMSKCRDTVKNMSYSMAEIAQAAEMLGLDRMSEQIFYHIDKLEAAVDRVNKAVSQSINERYVEAQASSVNVFKAVLAGIELRDEERNNKD